MKNKLPTRQKIKAALTRGGFSMFILIFLAAFADAQEKTVAEQMLKNINSPKPPAANKTRKKSPKPAPKQVAVRRKTKQIEDEPEINVVSYQKAVFLTGEPNIELWLGGKKIGVSGADSQIVAYLPVGEQTLQASKDGKILGVSLSATIAVQENKFDFSAPIKQAVAALPQPEEKPAAEAAAAPDVAGILTAYSDPQRTAEVTLKDWQTVYDYTMKQMLAGDTANQTEGYKSFAQGQIELAAGNTAKAVNAFSAAQLFLPENALIAYGLGNAHLAAGQFPESLTAYGRAIRLDAKFALAYKAFADALSAQGKKRESIAYYVQAKNLGVTSSELRLSLAVNHIKTDNCKDALVELEELTKKTPTSEIYLALGDCYLKSKRAVSAIEALQKAIELAPNAPVAYFRVGEVYLEEKEYSKAEEALERALALDVEGKIINRREVQNLIEKARKKAK